MKIGMPILFEYDSIEENLILAKQLNLDFVELNLNFSYCRKEMELGIVKDLLNKYQLEATLHFYDEADFGTYDEVCDAYLTLLNRYAFLGKDYVKIINFHNNPGPVVTIAGVKNFLYQKEYDEYIVKLINNFKKAKQIVDKYQIKMVIENVDAAVGQRFLIDNFVNLSKEGFHFNLDIGHDNIGNDAFYHELLKTPMILDEMHIHDSDRKKCHLCLGTGTIELQTYIDLAIKHDVYAVIEVKSSEDLINSIPMVRQLIENNKSKAK